jgi:hypothetical protein
MCQKTHKTHIGHKKYGYVKWTGRGRPRIYCYNCKYELGIYTARERDDSNKYFDHETVLVGGF